MPKAPKLPDDFRVDTHLSGKPSAHWTDGDRRYQFWLTESGRPLDSYFHSNPITPNPNSRRDEHRYHDPNAKRWAPLIALMVETIKRDNLIAKARAAEAARLKAVRDAAELAYHGKLLDALDVAVRYLPADRQEAIESLSRAAKIEFASVFSQNLG